ncbi:MAG: hypothetical protein ACRD8U_10810 [Pyrinomonadaceae bacterium]
MNALRTRTLELAIKEAQIQGKRQEIQALLNALKLQWRFLKAGIPIGSLLAGFGFACWYYRVQKPTDQLLLNQLEGKRAENDVLEDAP